MANSFTEQTERFKTHAEEQLKDYPHGLRQTVLNKIRFSHFDTDEDFKKYVQEVKEIHDKQVSPEDIKDGMAEITPGASARGQLNTQLKTQKEDNTLIDEVFKALKI